VLPVFHRAILDLLWLHLLHTVLHSLFSRAELVVHLADVTDIEIIVVLLPDVRHPPFDDRPDCVLLEIICRRSVFPERSVRDFEVVLLLLLLILRQSAIVVLSFSLLLP
jgi:hypothetical protein